MHKILGAKTKHFKSQTVRKQKSLKVDRFKSQIKLVTENFENLTNKQNDSKAE